MLEPNLQWFWEQRHSGPYGVTHPVEDIEDSPLLPAARLDASGLGNGGDRGMHRRRILPL